MTSHVRPETMDREATAVDSDSDGYIQLIDSEALIELATNADVLLRIERRPGQYVVKGMPLAVGWPHEDISAEFAAKVNSAFALGDQRTTSQDIEFPVDQLVEIAVRALSPGVDNHYRGDRFVDRLSSALHRLAER